jgi:hypothetical protein
MWPWIDASESRVTLILQSLCVRESPNLGLCVIPHVRVSRVTPRRDSLLPCHHVPKPLWSHRCIVVCH